MRLCGASFKGASVQARRNWAQAQSNTVRVCVRVCINIHVLFWMHILMLPPIALIITFFTMEGCSASICWINQINRSLYAQKSSRTDTRARIYAGKQIGGCIDRQAYNHAGVQIRRRTERRARRYGRAQARGRIQAGAEAHRRTDMQTYSYRLFRSSFALWKK